MFDAAERGRVLSALIAHAERDPSIASAALVGSLTSGHADRWSDIDLAFGVADGADLDSVVADWSRRLASEFDGCTLLDLESGGALYRVFLLPGCLQVDLSFAPGARVLRGSERFELLFGEDAEMDPTPASGADGLFGWGVLYARHAYVCIQRERWWQAANYVAAVRDAAMSLACHSRQLPVRFGKGYDQLPADLLRRFEATIFRSLRADDLAQALRAATGLLLEQGASVPWAAKVGTDLVALTGE